MVDFPQDLRYYSRNVFIKSFLDASLVNNSRTSDKM